MRKASNHNASCVVNKRYSFYGFDWHLRISPFVPVDYVSQTERLLIRGNCSTWVIFSDKLAPCRGTYSITLSVVTSKHERNGWQLILWLLFPFKVSLAFYGWSFLLWNFLEFSRNWGIFYKKNLLKIFRHFFFCNALIKLLKLLR